MHTVSKIMTTGIKALKLDDNVQDAQNLMKSHNIRHIPIVDHDNKFVGMLSQRTVLADAFRQFREGELNAQVNHALLSSVMESDVDVAEPDVPLVEAGKFFLRKKHACLPVVKEGTLEGIVTSVDFVKLCVELLETN